MSKDRIEFELKINGSEREKLSVAFRKAFAVEMPREGYRKENYESQYVKVRCRPSQFARFLIYRDQEGCRNNFKELGAKIILPEVEIPKIIDVSMERASF